MNTTGHGRIGNETDISPVLPCDIKALSGNNPAVIQRMFSALFRFSTGTGSSGLRRRDRQRLRGLRFLCGRLLRCSAICRLAMGAGRQNCCRHCACQNYVFYLIFSFHPYQNFLPVLHPVIRYARQNGLSFIPCSITQPNHVSNPVVKSVVKFPGPPYRNAISSAAKLSHHKNGGGQHASAISQVSFYAIYKISVSPSVFFISSRRNFSASALTSGR